MSNRSGLVSAVVLLLWATTGFSQGLPPGTNKYFGDGLNSSFTPRTLFPKDPPLPAPPKADAPPVTAILGTDTLPPSPPPKIWTGGAEFGVNGATGNTELLNIRAAFNVQRKTAVNVFNSDFLYTYAEQEGRLTTQQALYNARDEIRFAGTDWTAFAALQIEYDELRAYRYRTGLYAGAGYTVTDEETVTFKTRGGAGTVFETGSGNLENRWVPELVVGMDFSYRFTARSSFLSILDYYPRVDELGQFRIRARAGFEYLLDPALCMVLRIGVQDRYDSDPGNGNRNDLTYFTTIGMKF